MVFLDSKEFLVLESFGMDWGLQLQAWIFFIGGSSASGKSTVAKKIATQFDLPVITLDKFRNSIDEFVASPEDRTLLTRKISLQVIKELINVSAQCIVEGNWVTPECAADLRRGGFFYPVFCGYPDSNPVERYEAISLKAGSKDRHWLLDIEKEDAHAFLEKKVKASLEDRDECKMHGIDYVDCTDFLDGSAKISELFENQWQARIF